MIHALAEVLARCGVTVSFGTEQFSDFTLLVKTGVGFTVLELASIFLLHFFLLKLGDLFVT